jgi:AmmeMemoRadiSam system protein B
LIELRANIREVDLMSDSTEPSGSPIRRSPIAGTWYPGQPERLEQEVSAMLDAPGADEAAGELVALISPHAGLRYSGPVAAAGYRLLRRTDFDTAVLIGPSHFVHFQGASVYARGAFETPLGRIPIDEELAEAVLERDSRVRFYLEAHDREHCLEMQLPFLQVLAPRLAIVPVIMGDQQRTNVERVAKAVAAAVSESSKKVLLIASSDLSHYKSARVASIMDGEVSRLVERFDADALMQLFERDHDHACGGGPMVAVLKAAQTLGATEACILRYGDSGDVTGDKDQVVGYLSAAVFC